MTNAMCHDDGWFMKTAMCNTGDSKLISFALVHTSPMTRVSADDYVYAILQTGEKCDLTAIVESQPGIV